MSAGSHTHQVPPTTLTAAQVRILPPEYDDAIHRYSFQGIPYTSSTQVVEKFSHPFDQQSVAIAYAAKHGNTPEYWIQQWNQKRDESLVRGNGIHDANETALQGMQLASFQGTARPVHGPAIREEDDWYQRPDGIYTERKLWHHGYRVAGRADKIILETHGYISSMPATGKEPREAVRTAHIEDYKTNEKLDKVSYQYKSTGDYKMMKAPIAHIMDCNWWHYCLQLSLYMFMLEYQGFKPGTMSIIHYPHEGGKESHQVPYLRKEVVLMLQWLPRG